MGEAYRTGESRKGNRMNHPEFTNLVAGNGMPMRYTSNRTPGIILIVSEDSGRREEGGLIENYVYADGKHGSVKYTSAAAAYDTFTARSGIDAAQRELGNRPADMRTSRAII